MLRHSDIKNLSHTWVALLFRTLVIDRAGCLPQCHIVLAQIIGKDVSGSAILLTYGGLQLLFPVEAMHPATEGIVESLNLYPPTYDALKRLKDTPVSFVAGQELTWDIHSAVEPARLRRLDLEEIAEAMADSSALSRSAIE